MIDLLLGPWSWYISGILIAFIFFLFFYFDKNFGVSSNLETLCTLMGAYKVSDYFKKNWKPESWRLVFLIGLIIGGYIGITYLTASPTINLNPKTIQELENLGFSNVGDAYVPKEIFGIENILSFRGFLILIVAGFLIGFGTRYAGGCTSGHAITGLSTFQLPSLIAVIGFFIGGLIMVWFLFPLLFT